MGDIPSRALRDIEFRPGVAYPSNRRYTLQRLVEITPEYSVEYGFANNTDATFMRNTNLPMPSCLLLTYVYGMAAVVNWGRNWEYALSKENRLNLRRPQISQSPVMKPPHTVNDRRIAIDERNAYNNVSSNSVGGEWSTGRGCDAADLILLFWANTPAARKRREDEKERFKQRIYQWQEEIET